MSDSTAARGQGASAVVLELPFLGSVTLSLSLAFLYLWFPARMGNRAVPGYSSAIWCIRIDCSGLRPDLRVAGQVSLQQGGEAGGRGSVLFPRCHGTIKALACTRW